MSRHEGAGQDTWVPVVFAAAANGRREKKPTQAGVGEAVNPFPRSPLQPGAKPAVVLARKHRGTMAHEAGDLGQRPILGRSRSTANALEAVGLPPGSAVPRLTCTAAGLTSLPLDPRAAFLAAQVDGKTTVQNILDLASMKRVEALAALDRLVKLGVVVFA